MVAIVTWVFLDLPFLGTPFDPVDVMIAVPFPGPDEHPMLYGHRQVGVEYDGGQLRPSRATSMAQCRPVADQ